MLLYVGGVFVQRVCDGVQRAEGNISHLEQYQTSVSESRYVRQDGLRHGHGSPI